MLPDLIRESVERYGLPRSIRADEVVDECEGAAFHSPTPLVVREVKVGKVTAKLCDTCASNLRLLNHLMARSGGLDWPVLRSFGNKVRRLARLSVGIDDPVRAPLQPTKG